nr:MAG TPA: terminase [Caudoviricetes sp.]
MSDFIGMNLEFKDFDRLLRKDELAEQPVPIEVFVQDKKYLGLPPLSEIQTEIVRHSTQIFKKHTLINLMGEEAGSEYYDKYTDNEVICMLGKGSGKDHCARISMAYTTYLLHCLNDPLTYFGKARGVYIDLLNLAVNAQQAQRVFFEPFKNLLLGSPYFNEVGFEPRVSEIFFFSRPVRCFSGHSESEGWEGYEVMTVILDEISAFKTDAELRGETRSKGSASAIYNMSKLSVMSRFPEVGKVILLSFPRYKGDFIQQRFFNSRDKNEPKTWSMKAATWEVNPTIKREQLESEYIRNPIEARARFECEPPNMEDAYFRDADSVRKAFNYREDPMDEDGVFKPWFNNKDGHVRFIHVDLALKRDRAALSMVHCAGFKELQTSMGVETLPIINVDLVHSWEATIGAEINFASIRQMIIDLCRKFDVGVVTFDRWQSVEMIQSLRSQGINADFHSVKKTDYDTLTTAIYDTRLRGYWNEILVEEELLKLRLFANNKIDHPSTGSKDLADALAGAVYMCMDNVAVDNEIEIEVLTPDPFYEYDEDMAEFTDVRMYNKELGEFTPTNTRKTGDVEQWIEMI